MPPGVVVVNNIPAPDSNTSDVAALWVGCTACLIYGIQSELDEHALVLARRCTRLVLGGPNDEAFHRHRFFDLGLKPARCQKIEESPWIAEISRETDKDGNVSRISTLRHFVFASKESSVDALCESLELVAVSASLPNLINEAARRCGMA